MFPATHQLQNLGPAILGGLVAMHACHPRRKSGLGRPREPALLSLGGGAALPLAAARLHDPERTGVNDQA
jgi:hypothetical protein